MDPGPFLCGNAFPATRRAPYPRAKPSDAPRLPADTWMQALIPATVRLELAGDAEAVDVTYRTSTEDLGYRGTAGGVTFDVWRALRRVDEQKAELGEHTVSLALGDAPDHRAIVYMPEAMRPELLAIEPRGGSIEPAGERVRWICYGDSIAEGWCASGPAMAWPAIVAREYALDAVNMGYAGAARGEIVSAEEIAELPAGVIAIAHGTNCWTRIPHTAAQMRANLAAFIDVVRQGHPSTPLVVVSPILRPDAEATPNRLGATLADLRTAIEDVARARDDVRLIPGAGLVDVAHLDDGIHPNDEGHLALAHAIGPVLRDLGGAD